ILQSPGRVFPTGTTAEIFASQQDRSALVTRLIKHKIRIQLTLAVIHTRLAMIEVTPFIERIWAKAAALDGFKELLGNNGVGIDVSAIQRRNQSIQCRKWLHQLLGDFCIFSPTFSTSLPKPCQVLQPASTDENAT